MPHFDLMFEASPGAPLLTWRSMEWPIERETELTKLDDHRPAYLEYEGPISNDRGHVKRAAGGTCEMFWPNAHECRVRLDDSADAIQLKQMDDDHWLATRE